MSALFLIAAVLQVMLTIVSSTTAANERLFKDRARPMETTIRQSGDGSCQGGDQYMCLDWTFGSSRMGAAQASYKPETFFVVGAYGPTGNLGKCYEFKKGGTTWTLVGQVINEGRDVRIGQFDIQTGAGGFGLNNACTRRPGFTTTASGSQPMFSEDASAFGRTFGGVQSYDACSRAPRFPAVGSPRPGKVSVQELCRRAFSWGGRNGHISTIRRISCPWQLYTITGLRLSDDSSFQDTEHRTGFGYTTTTMDCCKPAAAFPLLPDGRPRFHADPRYPYVRACRRDGYTPV